MDDFPPGYSKVAAVEGCDPNFLIYRKFSWLHNRVLLHHQDELVELEDELRRLDKFDLENDARKLISRRLDDAIKGSRRKELLQEIEKKLAVYRQPHRRVFFTVSNKILQMIHSCASGKSKQSSVPLRGIRIALSTLS